MTVKKGDLVIIIEALVELYVYTVIINFSDLCNLLYVYCSNWFLCSNKLIYIVDCFLYKIILILGIRRNKLPRMPHFFLSTRSVFHLFKIKVDNPLQGNGLIIIVEHN